MRFPESLIRLPGWIESLVPGEPVFPTFEDRMRFAVLLARMNVERKTGGPFGAAVFDRDGALVAPGVNMVVSCGCSVLHAEIVALALSQARTGSYDLGQGDRGPYELTASSEPCAMCLGAIPWSGVSRLVCGARDEDVRRIGFDEGHKQGDWREALASRGVRVVRDVLRQDAVRVLELYVEMGGPIYNAGRPSNAKNRARAVHLRISASLPFHKKSTRSGRLKI